ncbi:integrase core domain-containing protein [Streptomyces olivoreticuli]
MAGWAWCSPWDASGRPWTTRRPRALNSTTKVEYVHRHRFRTRTEARIKIATWITDWYNRHRRHSACDWLSPIDYENRHHTSSQQAQAA